MREAKKFVDGQEALEGRICSPPGHMAGGVGYCWRWDERKALSEIGRKEMVSGLGDVSCKDKSLKDDGTKRWTRSTASWPSWTRPRAFSCSWNLSMRASRCSRAGSEPGSNLNLDAFAHGGDGLGTKRVEREV